MWIFQHSADVKFIPSTHTHILIPFEWMNENLYIVHKKLPHKTLRVYCAFIWGPQTDGAKSGYCPFTCASWPLRRSDWWFLSGSLRQDRFEGAAYWFGCTNQIIWASWTSRHQATLMYQSAIIQLSLSPSIFFQKELHGWKFWIFILTLCYGAAEFCMGLTMKR